MTKSELIDKIAAVQEQLSAKDVELAVKMILDYMATALAEGERIEIRGFGSFSVELTGKFVPHFKPGKELRDRVNLGMQVEMAASTQEIEHM